MAWSWLSTAAFPQSKSREIKSNIDMYWGYTMSYAIVGFGKIGQALAHAFARKNIEVTVASRRQPEELAPLARAIGPTVRTQLGCKFRRNEFNDLRRNVVGFLQFIFAFKRKVRRLVLTLIAC
ncbi:NAD(P)-binding domain-containing protein [Tunturiibacter psychrotolerans]|uniref:NAD(P)-binding domain-containing protein n=1 Tax=Tunturiibacter psychrotolerans TaxID=3069686 RepID=UPI003D20458E